MTDDGDPLSFLGDHDSAGHRVRTVVLEPGDGLDVRPADWSGVLVVVEAGLLRIECDSGTRATFSSGAILVLTMPGLRRIHSVGPTALVLSAVSRRPAGD